MRLLGIRLHDVSRRFGRHLALRGVSVGFDAGQIALLLGPSGAGKSTLRRVASTLLRPTRGLVTASVEHEGARHEVDLFELAEHDRAFLGLVSHASLIYHDLTGRENLDLFGRLYGLSAEVTRTRAEALIRELDLLDAADRLVAGYSRGMRQRLSIARALIQGPSVLLLDEPFTGLDQSGNRILYGVLRRLRAEGCLTLLITHNLDLPHDLIDRALLLNHGRVAHDGRPDPDLSLALWYEQRLKESA